MTSVSPPRRQFLPEPVETSTRSSKRALDDSTGSKSPNPTRLNPTQDDSQDTNPMAAQIKPRRWLPQPVEETHRSSRKNNMHEPEFQVIDSDKHEEEHIEYINKSLLTNGHDGEITQPSRRFAPEPLETTKKSSRRRFAPEPVETTVKSSRDKKRDETADSDRPRRRFVAEPVETSSRSSRHPQTEANEQSPGLRPRRRFVPEPIEITTETRRRRRPDSEKDGDPADEQPTSPPLSSGRKFSPELLETARGSYRRGYASPRSPIPKHLRAASPAVTQDVDGVPESKFSHAALARRLREEKRQPSFVVPDLPMIESDSGDDYHSETPSLSHSQSSIDTDRRYKSPDTKDSYTEYVLRLAAQTATEQELQNQAMAAYINERPHEPVDHFAIEEDENVSKPVLVGKLSGDHGVDVRTFRRSSAADLDWEMHNMRQHHAQLEKAKQVLKNDTAGHSRFSAAALATRHHLEKAKAARRKTKKAKAEDSELAKMRAAASPPMLGEDIVFPFTISPKMTRCDPDQIPRPRRADSDDEMEVDTDPNLWTASIGVSNESNNGLWMGLCQKPNNSRPTTPLRSGIQTPAFERSNPFDTITPKTPHTPGLKLPRTYLNHSFLQLTPIKTEDAFTNSIDRKLKLEKQIEEEFPDRVVTQVYNYLSLGYPSLAHAFDEELSKISRIPIEELRKDDDFANAKGYVGVPEGDGSDENEVVGHCKRWEALKLYVREWARQSPNFASERQMALSSANNNWGATVRKGSWAH